MGYVETVRRALGHDLLLLPGVTVLVSDDAGRLLLVEQVDRGEWSTVGGGMEPGESPSQAAVREAAEETGLQIEVTGLVGVVGGDGYEIVYPNGDRCAYVSIVFTARVLAGSPRPDGTEVARCRWVPTADITEMRLSPFTRRLLGEVGVLVDAGPPAPTVQRDRSP